MKKLKKIFLLLVVSIVFVTIVFSQPCKEVIAYYPNWQWYDRNNLVSPANIDYSKYTIINYSFFNPLSNGSIVQTDIWADENLLFGEHDWANGGYLPNTSLIDIAHNNGVLVMVSIGGWTLSNAFPLIAADTVKRTFFASECVRLLSEFGFDGIDIDWEYPGYAPHNGTIADGVNFTLLLQEIRDSIDAYGLQTNNDYLLSACFSADPVKMAIVDWTAITGILDMVNLMSYDFFGAFSSLSNHNSPLYAPVSGNPDFNVHSAFTNITQVFGVPSSLVNIGVPFYGRSVAGCPGLHQSNAGYADASTFWEDDGSPTYYNVLKNMSSFTSHWDSVAMVPYLIGNSINTFVSYDDVQSVALKAEYVVNSGARGVIVWELTGDYIETFPGSGVVAQTPLIDTINQMLCSIITDIEEPAESLGFSIYPNLIGANNKIQVNYKNNDAIKPIVIVSSIYGRKVLQKSMDRNYKGDFSADISINTAGIYIVSVNSKNTLHSKRVIVF